MIPWRRWLGLAPRHIFVVGCGHTGTTLVAAMLGAHPSIYSIPDETYAFIRKRKNKPRQVIDRAAAQGDKFGAKYICEKTPDHLLHISRIKAVFPRARFVVTMRDPRDVVCSLKRRTWPLQRGIDRWRNSAEIILAMRDQPDSFMLRYEDLIADPEGTLARACRFLSLPYDPAMLDYWKDQRDWQGVTDRRDTDGHEGENHNIRRNWQVHQPLMRERIGVFKKELDRGEIEAIDLTLGTLAREFGYDLSSAPYAPIARAQS